MLEKQVLARKFYNNRRLEGFRSKDKRDDQTKCPRLETRMSCSVSLILKLVQESNKYEVTKFISEHNHVLQLPQACYRLPCQRKVSIFYFQLYFLDVRNNDDNLIKDI